MLLRSAIRSAIDGISGRSGRSLADGCWMLGAAGPAGAFIIISHAVHIILPHKNC